MCAQPTQQQREARHAVVASDFIVICERFGLDPDAMTVSGLVEHAMRMAAHSERRNGEAERDRLGGFGAKNTRRHLEGVG